MPTLTTLYRSIVMLAAGIIIVKGWQYCGPSTEQVKSISGRILQIAAAAWNPTQPPSGSAPASSASTPPISPSLAPAPAAAAPVEAFQTSPAFPVLDRSLGAAPVIQEPPLLSRNESMEAPAVAVDKSQKLSADGADRLPMLMTRLAELGGVEPQLGPWGQSGQLYRFHCRATWAGSPNYLRHFEAVAAEPLAAVEDVLAKVQAWRTAQHDRSEQR